MMKRRELLSGMAAFGALAVSRPSFAAEPGLRLKMGVISDVHIRCLPGRTALFRKALEWYRDQGVDAVMIAGDIADSGRVAELQLYADAWFSVFPDDRAPDGRRVERLFVLGNHCVDAWAWARNNPHYRSPITDEKARLEDSIGYSDVIQRAWPRLFHEDYHPIWMKTVKGYPVIGAHWNSHKPGIPIEDFMRVHAKDIDPHLPFFYVQHEHPRDTCFGFWAWGHDDGRSTRALSPFPNAVAFSGHSHTPLTDERSIWQGAFASVNTAALFDAGCDFALRENAMGNRFGYIGERLRPRRQDVVCRDNFAQGLLVSVYDERITTERHDFYADAPIGDPWVLPIPLGREKPYAFATRRASRVAPAFAADARVTVARRTDAKHGVVYDVAFPCADMREKCRAYEYEVTATLVEDEVDVVQAQRRVLANDYRHPDLPKFRKPGLCVFALADLPLKGSYRFSVRPIECFGRKGDPIVSEIVKVS